MKVTKQEKIVKKQTAVRQILEPIILNISWAEISRDYFGKSRSWLYQRIKGNTVNGKPAEFTDEEKERFHFALSDIGNKASCFQL